MNLYYIQDGREIGPVSEAEFEALVRSGTLPAATQFRRTGSDFIETAASSLVSPNTEQGQGETAPRVFCSECGSPHSPDELMQFQGRAICGNCKDVLAQRLRQGAPVAPTQYHYAGFWIRVVATLIDGMLQSAVVFVLVALLMPVLGGGLNRSPRDPTALDMSRIGLIYLLSLVINVAYQAYFLTSKNATLGKMAVGLKVIRPGNQPITVGLAIGRYFCYFIDAIPLYIGFIIAGFDAEKRALHDRICNTRVIYSR